MLSQSNDNLYENLLSKAISIYRSKGLKHLLHSSFWYLIDMYVTSAYYNKFKSSETFQFQGKSYHYVFHRYCTTWKNERCAIIPIAREMVLQYQKQGKKILEVGNVMSYIYPVVHDVIDKYEIVEGVINKDIVDFQTSKRYDLIFSIVTIQNIGNAESPSYPSKVLKAIGNLKKILALNGEIVILHPLAENKEMDELIKKGLLRFSDQFYLMKVSKYKWKEASWEDVKDLSYDYSIPSARGIIIGYINKYG
jgi:hypothetical protein